MNQDKYLKINTVAAKATLAGAVPDPPEGGEGRPTKSGSARFSRGAATRPGRPEAKKHKKGGRSLLRRPTLLVPNYEILMVRAGFSFASSFLGMTTCKTPSLCRAEIFSAFRVSGMLKERENEE